MTPTLWTCGIVGGAMLLSGLVLGALLCTVRRSLVLRLAFAIRRDAKDVAWLWAHGVAMLFAFHGIAPIGASWWRYLIAFVVVMAATDYIYPRYHESKKRADQARRDRMPVIEHYAD